MSRDKAASAQLHVREEGATLGEQWGVREAYSRGRRYVTLLLSARTASGILSSYLILSKATSR
jgi:hypothetical protein